MNLNRLVTKTERNIAISYALLTVLIMVTTVILIILAHSQVEAERAVNPPSVLSVESICSLDAVVCEGEEEQIGVASWYNYDLPNNPDWGLNHFTMASRTLPRYSYATVTNLNNGKSVRVFVNDWVENEKVIGDLSYRAFEEIADPKLGLIMVKIIK